MRLSYTINDQYYFSFTRFIKLCILVACNFGVIGVAAAAIQVYNKNKSATVIAKVQESLVLTEGIISFILGNTMHPSTERYPLMLAIFGILITAIPLAIRIATTGFNGDTSKIGVEMLTHNVAAILMIVSLVTWISLIQFEFDIEMSMHWPFISCYRPYEIPTAVSTRDTENATTTNNNPVTVARNVSTLSATSSLPGYTPPEELPLYSKTILLPPVYENSEIGIVEPVVIDEELERHEDENGGESSIQALYGRCTSYLNRS